MSGHRIPKVGSVLRAIIQLHTNIESAMYQRSIETSESMGIEVRQNVPKTCTEERMSIMVVVDNIEFTTGSNHN